MSIENKDVLTRANAAVSAGDYDGFLTFCTDDTRWEFVGDRTLAGKEAVRDYMRTAYGKPPRVTVDRLIAEGDFLTAIGTIRVQDAAGRSTHAAYCDVWQLRDGKLADLRAFVVELDPAG